MIFITTILTTSIQVSLGKGSLQQQEPINTSTGFIQTNTELVAGNGEADDSLATVVNSYEERIRFLENEVIRVGSLSRVDESEKDKEIDQLRSQLDDLAHENNQLKEDLEASKEFEKRVHVLMIQNNEQHETIKKLKQAVWVFEQIDINGLRTQVNKLTDDKQKLESELVVLKEKEEKLENAEEQIKQLEKSSLTLQLTIGELEKSLADAKAESEGKVDKAVFNELKDEAQKLGEWLDKSKEDNKELRFQVDNLEKALDKSAEGLNEYVSKLEESNAHIKVLTEELGALSNDFEQIGLELQDQQKRSDEHIKKIETELANKDGQLSGLRHENHRLEAKYEEAWRKNNLNKVEIRQLKEEEESLKVDKKNLESRVKTLETQVTKMQFDKEQLKQEINDLNKQIEELLHRIEEEVKKDEAKEGDSVDVKKLKRNFSIVIRNLKGQIKMLQQRILQLEAELGLQNNQNTQRAIELKARVVNQRNSTVETVPGFVTRKKRRNKGLFIGNQF